MIAFSRFRCARSIQLQFGKRWLTVDIRTLLQNKNMLAPDLSASTKYLSNFYFKKTVDREKAIDAILDSWVNRIRAYMSGQEDRRRHEPLIVIGGSPGMISIYSPFSENQVLGKRIFLMSASRNCANAPNSS